MKQGIVYDVTGQPRHMTMVEVVEIYKNFGFIIWSSTEPTGRPNNAQKPYLIDQDEECDKILIDVSTEEGMNKYKKLLK